MSGLDQQREPVDTGSFGTTVVTLMCKRVAYLEDLNDGDGVTDVRGDTYRDVCRLGLAPPAEAPDTLQAMHAKRDVLIDAVDATFPDEFLPDLQTFLTSNEFLALYDDGTTLAATDDLIEMLRLMESDPELAPALARVRARLGYVPVQEALGAVRAFVNYPDMHQFLLSVLEQVTAGGQAKAEFDNFVEAVGVTLRNAEPVADPTDDERTGMLALDLLYASNDLLGTSQVIPLVRRDHRGLALVAGTGALPEPFVDMDNDGFADADADGRFVDAEGVPVAAPAPFLPPDGDAWPYRDADGHALDAADGVPVYEYVDLDATVFAALSRDAIQLFDPQKGTALDLMRGGSAMMSALPRQVVTREYPDGSTLEYRGYDTSSSPLLDMLHGYLSVLRDPLIHDVLDLARSVLRNREPEIARIAEMGIDARDLAAAHPEAIVDPDAPLWDDMVPVIRNILAVPGLAEALIVALERPEVAELSLRFRDYMKYKDQFGYNASKVLTGSFATLVDRTQPDRAYNRSLMQRLLHIISDSNGAELCSKAGAVVTDPLGLGLPLQSYDDECELFRIQNLAVFYVQSIAYAKDGSGNVICENDSGDVVSCGSGGAHPRRKAHLQFNWNNALIAAIVDDALISDMVEIDGFTTHPTPEALNRALFTPPNDFVQDVMDPARTKYNQLYSSTHSGTLPVWEKDGFYDQIRPVVQAFADRNAEQLFVDLLSVLHKHWATRNSAPTHQFNLPNQAGYVWGSSAMTYEPLMVAILDRRATSGGKGNLLDALVASAPTLNQVTINSKKLPRLTADAARYLFTPRAGLVNRTGAATSQTSEGTEIPVLSPWQLLADAYALKRVHLTEAAAEGEAWQRSTGNVVDVLLRADPVPTVGWRFRNPRTRGVLVALIDFLETRLEAHEVAGDKDVWLADDLPARLEDTLAGPVFAGAADFILSLQASPEARAQIEALAAYLVNEVNYNETFRTSLSAIADLLQLSLDDADIVPIARFAGEAVRADRGWLESHLVFARQARAGDTNQALVDMMRNLYVEHRPGHTAVGDLIDGISEIHRARPYEDLGQPYTAEDYRSLFGGIAGFLDDNKRGLRRFISIIEERNLR